MPATCGIYRYGQLDLLRGPRPMFLITAQPDVAMRFRRVFPGHKLTSNGEIAVSASHSNARDLAWFIVRHPMRAADDESQAVLERMAAEHAEAEEQTLRILDGTAPTTTLARTPACEPRPYQQTVVELVRARGFLILGDDLGLGKTFSSSLICLDPDALPALVVAPVHLLDQWANEELPKYYPWIRTHILRKAAPYDIAAHPSCKGRQPDVLLSSYEKLYGWAHHLPGHIKTVIFDEGDALRTGDGTRKYDAALRIARKARYRILATATPVHNWADEIWNIADLLSEGVLGTPGEFRETWGGRHRELGEHLRNEGIMLRRTRKDVGRELPPVSQMIHPVETDHARIKAEMDGIIAMAVKVLDTNSDRAERFTLAGQLDLKLRQATGIAKAPHVAAFVRLLLEQEEKVVIAGHHHAVYDIWREHLAEFNPVLYTGRQSDKQKAAAKREFIHGNSRVMIMAIRSGAGLNGLQDVCATPVIGELDWTPARHKQFVGRFNRDGQTRPVTAFFLLSDAGSDPLMAELLDLKRQVAEPINDPDAPVLEPSTEEAERRVQALARDLLRRHGVAVPKPGEHLPDPVPGSGELIAASSIRVPGQASAPQPVAPEHAVAATLAAVTARASNRRVLEQRPAPLGADRPAAKSRDALRARLTGDRA